MAKESKRKILIVEDDAIISKTYAEELHGQGFLVMTAVNGRAGLDIALNQKPDLILLDILMPVMDGLTMMDKLRAKSVYGKNVPIMLLTNLSGREQEILEAVTKNEPVYYMVKSDWNLSDVVKKIEEQLTND